MIENNAVDRLGLTMYKGKKEKKCGTQWESNPQYQQWFMSRNMSEGLGIYIYIHNPSTTNRMLHEANFKRILTGLNTDFFFLLLGWLPKYGQRAQPILLFSHGKGENSWIYIFPHGISSTGNANGHETISFEV